MLYIDYLESFDDLIPVSKLEEEIEASGEEMPALGLSASDAHPVRTLFFGSGTVALPALSRLLAGRAGRDRLGRHRTTASGRTQGPAHADARGRRWPAQHGLPRAYAAQRCATRVCRQSCERSSAELIVLADYGRIIPAAVLDLPRHGALNIHPSLLPRHRGAAPVVGSHPGRRRRQRRDRSCAWTRVSTRGPIVAQREVATRRHGGRT